MIRIRTFLTSLMRRTDGVSAVEFALVVPVMTLLFAGLVDVGSLAWTAMQVHASARAGTAYALTHGYNSTSISSAMTNATNLPITVSTTPVQGYGCPSASTGVTTAGVTATTVCASGATAGKYVRVGASANYSALFSWPGLANPLTLSSTSIVRIP